MKEFILEGRKMELLDKYIWNNWRIINYVILNEIVEGIEFYIEKNEVVKR